MIRIGATVLAAGLVLAGPLHAQDATAPAEAGAPAFVPSLPQTLAGVPGTWDLSRDASTRRCVLTLSAASGEAGRRLTFPAGCRRALPVLNRVAGWLFTEDAIRLVDKDVRPVLAFKRRSDARSYGAGLEDGEAYSLVPLQIAATGAAEAAAMPAAAPQNGPRDPLARPAGASGPEPAPGLYALDRFKEQDVCRVELLAGEAAKPAPVRLVEGCRDTGIAVFDPVLWQAGQGRMTLRAKRGHTVELVPVGEGRWRRDPDVGTTFVLRRVEP
ncbi:AprI/Inh family metalloprotease inhibitor [Methylobacterium sp. Leaf466]|uniref:AprI/Inh family metalloprotease inhibitor n=1 Tax=Methylobacterium sp. Leaf466 TaxID=1736386 RepID=UPI0009EB12CA|nr:AprI/Inh family metalloprotease inhibitor [Methylobacterium sp. Leaf466]